MNGIYASESQLVTDWDPVCRCFSRILLSLTTFCHLDLSKASARIIIFTLKNQRNALTCFSAESKQTGSFSIHTRVRFTWNVATLEKIVEDWSIKWPLWGPIKSIRSATIAFHSSLMPVGTFDLELHSFEAAEGTRNIADMLQRLLQFTKLHFASKFSFQKQNGPSMCPTIAKRQQFWWKTFGFLIGNLVYSEEWRN